MNFLIQSLVLFFISLSRHYLLVFIQFFRNGLSLCTLFMTIYFTKKLHEVALDFFRFYGFESGSTQQTNGGKNKLQFGDFFFFIYLRVRVASERATATANRIF